MKGIVVDLNNKDAVILTEDGLFKRIENRNYEIGQTLQISSGEKTGLRRFVPKPVISSKLLIGAARIAAVIVIGTAGAFAWYTPTSYISLDVNPSVEYSINMFDRILEARAVNEDGEEILRDLQLKNKNIGEGLKETLDELIAEGYLSDDPDSGVVIAASNEKQKEAEKMAMELKAEVQTYLKARKDVTAEVDAGAASPQKVKEAKGLGVTPGKLHLVEKLQASTTGAIEMEQWLAKPVKEINKEIKKNRETAAVSAFDPTWNRNRDWEWDWTQYGKQPEKAGVKKEVDDKGADKGRSAWEKSVYQTWSRNQKIDNGKKEPDEIRGLNRDIKDNNQNKAASQNESRNGDNNRKQKQDQDRKRDQKQNEDRNRDQNRSPDQGRTQNQSPNLKNLNRNQNWEQDWSGNWNLNRQQDKNGNSWGRTLEQKENRDQNKNQNLSKNKDRNQNQNQNKNQNHNQNQNQNQNHNQNQNKNLNQVTPGGIENGGNGNRPGGPGKPDRWGEGGNGGNDGDNRPGFKKSKDRD